jgi:hypothetical protein
MESRSIYDNCRLQDKKSIRLLQIVRTSPVPVLSLHPYRIDEAPDYHALSYTWGNPLPPLAPGAEVYDETVKCVLTYEDVESNVSITRNLFDALCALAERSINGPLWIDAVCINQDNMNERQEQVTMMGQIYASAHEVIVWLGLASNLDKDAIILHNEFIPALRRHFGGSLPAPEDLRVLSLGKLLELGLLSDPQAFKSYEWFRRRAWFQRAWTFQESFLAHEITVLYDDYTIEWRNLIDFAFYDLNLHQTITIQKQIPEAHELGMPTYLCGLEDRRAKFGIGSQDNAFRSYFNTHSRVNLEGKTKERSTESHLLLVDEDEALEKSEKRRIRASFLLIFVVSIRDRRCMDLRDKVFAAIGSVNHLVPSNYDDDMFPIRYDMSVERTYETFAIWILKAAPLMHILSLVEDPSERCLVGLPSWVPDLSIVTRLEGLNKEATVKEGFSEFPVTSHTVTRVEGKHRLCLVGFRMETIDSVDAVPVSDILPSGHRHLEALFDFCINMEPIYPSGEGRVEAVWRTLVMNSERSSPSRLAGQRSVVAQKNLGLSFDSLILSLVTMRVLQIILEHPSAFSISGNDILEAVGKATSNILKIYFRSEQWDSAESFGQKMLPSKDDVTRRVLECLNLIEKNGGGISALNILGLADDEPWKVIGSLRTEGRRLLRTSDGWIGLAPCSTQVGDEVWSFQDSPIPYILRPRHAEVGTYSYIGESYMHGFVAEGEPSDQEWTEVVLV